MSDLADFLLARFAEDELDGLDTHRASCASLADPEGYVPMPCDCGYPARVLAECEAKRRIVEDALLDVRDARRRPGWTIPDSEVDEKGRDYRVGYENARAKLLPEALDRTERLLRLLALPDADHPDYREEWRL